MYDVVILFGYYERSKEVVLSHHRAFVRDNPGVPIVPLVCGAPRWLLGTVNVEPLASVWLTQNEVPITEVRRCNRLNHKDVWLWQHNDQIYWRYLRSPKRLQACRYVIFEWDAFSHGMSVKDFFRSVWDAPCASVEVGTHQQFPNWSWWYPELIKQVGSEHAYYCRPPSGSLFSAEVADLLSQTTPPDYLRKAFCEVYYPNLCALHGIIPSAMPERITMHHVYGGPCSLKDEPGIYHPIPHLTQLHDAE